MEDPYQEPWFFCMWRGVQEEYAGTCGEGGYFNDTDTVCTCTNMTGKSVIIIYLHVMKTSKVNASKPLYFVSYYAYIARFC